MLQNILNWLNGKKTLIYGIGTMVISYLVTDHTLAPALGTLLEGLLSLLCGVAHGVTQDMSPMGANRLKLRK